MLMAMQSGNAVVTEKMHGGGGGGGEMMMMQQQQQGRGQQWWHNYQPAGQQHLVQMDEREGFMLWLRGEFAAANAIIDALCHHLRVVGEPGEYDGVIGCIQQRRCNWNSVLHMQQYFSVNEVAYALQQVGWRRNQSQRGGFEGSGKGGKEYRRGGGGRGGQRWEGFKEGKEGQHGQNLSNNEGTLVNGKEMNVNGNENLESGEGRVGNGKVEEKKEAVVKPEVDSSVEVTGSRQAVSSGSCNVENDTHSERIPQQEQNLTVTPKTFVANETFDGKTVNVVDGLKLYEEIFDNSEVSKLVALVNDLRVAGKRGQFQGQTFVVSRRPMKGHGREMIQFGPPIADAPPEDEASSGTSKDRKMEPIPSLFEDIIERLVALQVVSVKPDSCIVDIFNEGDHSQPHTWPHWFGRPVCVLFLTDCEMTFGKVIGIDHPGDYRGSLRLSLTPGSLMLLDGRSSDFARHAIPSIRKQRILVTLTKSQPKKITSSDAQRFPSSAPVPSHWVPPPGRSPNHIRHPVGPKPFGPVPTNGVLPAPPARPPLPPPNGIQPIFVPAAVAPAIPFPAPVALPPATAAWPAAPPRHPQPRLPVPGTGVFLPPSGSGNSANQSSISTPATENANMEASSLAEKDEREGNSKVDNASPKVAVSEKVEQQECNGSTDEIDGKKSIGKEEQHDSVDLKATGGSV
ncbi:RNA demethylase ALKBH10B-like isoform X3 [Coffea arabica]|uniref:RNA demethylase ALKBH10B-like isoform X3 n=1 Tax=Coffea arabica TaxID=13443 RepID=A0ABM4W3V7_COFAR